MQQASSSVAFLPSQVLEFWVVDVAFTACWASGFGLQAWCCQPSTLVSLEGEGLSALRPMQTKLITSLLQLTIIKGEE